MLFTKEPGRQHIGKTFPRDDTYVAFDMVPAPIGMAGLSIHIGGGPPMTVVTLKASSMRA
jgi:hypothetical protein